MKNISILGAGTAGLVAALILKKANPKYNISVIESDTVGIIGVGEGSTEHWKMFVDYCDININRLVRETDAALKKGIKFENWNGDGKSYFHSLAEPFFSEYSKDFGGSLVFSRSLISAGVKTSDVIVDTNLVHYGAGLHAVNQYHFNTFKLNAFLHTLCSERGITFFKDTILDVSLKENGDVASLTGQSGEVYSADFFIDSSGFKRVISSKQGVKWVSYKKYLPMNHAIAFPTEDISDLKPYTLSRALSSGWNWRISTQGRYGNGYVFCDDFIDSDGAYKEVQSVYNETVNVAKDIKFEAGRVDRFWVNNCVSIGLSASFVEPLEASSIGNSILQAFALAKTLSNWNYDKSVSDLYDSSMIKSFDNIVDFVQLHYMTKRDDTEFWRALPTMMQKTEFVEKHLENFKRSLPSQSLFRGDHLMFNAPNWAQVMDGLELFDRETIKKDLIESYGSGIIDDQMKKYQEYLTQIEQGVYIDHKVLLEQNRTFVKLTNL